MKVTVIGANSFIARNLLVVLKRRFPNVQLRLYDCADTHADGEQAYEKVQILDRASVSNIDLKADIVFMFVGKTGSAAGFDDYDTFIDINERALLHVLEAYRKQESKAKIVFPSTRLVYKGSSMPLKETDEKEFRTIYSINKFACEQYLEQFSRVYGVRYCIFRICVPYGSLIPGASSYGTIEFMRNRAMKGENIQLYGNGEVRRTFTHIEDLCNNLIDGAVCTLCKNDFYNIGGEDWSLLEVAERIAARYGVGVEHVEYPRVEACIESGNTVFDASKLAALGIYPRRKIEDWINSQGSEEDEKMNRGGVHDSVNLFFFARQFVPRNKNQTFINVHFSPHRRAA